MYPGGRKYRHILPSTANLRRLLARCMRKKVIALTDTENTKVVTVPALYVSDLAALDV